MYTPVHGVVFPQCSLGVGSTKSSDERTLAQPRVADNHGVDACSAGALFALALVVVGFAAVTVVGQRRGEDINAYQFRRRWPLYLGLGAALVIFAAGRAFDC